MRSHGPNFVPWGTSAGTEDHSWWQSFASLIRCFRFIRKSMIQHTIWRGMSFVNNFCTKMLWFIRSKAFRKLNKTTRLVAPFPSVLTHNLCVMLIRACVVLELGIGPNWCTSIFLRTAGLHSFLRHVFQQSWRLWVWVRLGVGAHLRLWLVVALELGWHQLPSILKVNAVAVGAIENITYWTSQKIGIFIQEPFGDCVRVLRFGWIKRREFLESWHFIHQCNFVSEVPCYSLLLEKKSFFKVFHRSQKTCVDKVGVINSWLTINTFEMM